MVTEDGGVAHVFLIAGRLSTKLTTDNGDSNPISISVDTIYPFGMTLEYTISAARPFAFYVRIPEWANSSTSTITGPSSAGTAPSTSSAPKPLSPSAKGLQCVAIPAGVETTFSITLSTAPRVVATANNTAAVYYGALLYSLAIEPNVTETPPHNYARETALLPPNTTHAHTHDHVMVPAAGSVWNVAIDTAQIRVVVAGLKNGGGGDDGGNDQTAPLPNPVWALGGPPVELRVAAVEIEWPLAFDSPAAPPARPKAIGKPFSARFVPYGSAKLRMTQLPVLSLPKVDLV